MTVGTYLARRVVRRWFASWTLIEGGVSVSYSDGDSAAQFFGVPSSPDPGQRLDNGALPIVNVAQSANVDLGLNLQTLP